MLKHSHKRDAILDCIRGTTCHPTAEWIHQQLKPQYPDLSLGTVYRNLTLFRQQGLIRCLETATGTVRVDGDLSPHAHFCCRTCGAVTDRFEIPVPEADADCGQVERVDLVYYGVCRECLIKE